MREREGRKTNVIYISRISNWKFQQILYGFQFKFLSMLDIKTRFREIFSFVSKVRIELPFGSIINPLKGNPTSTPVLN